MFRNYAIRPQLINLKKTQEHTCQSQPLVTGDDVAEIATVAAYWTKRAAIGITVIYTVKKVVDTASEVALIAARTNFK